MSDAAADAFDAAPVGLALWSAEGALRRWNAAFAGLYADLPQPLAPGLTFPAYARGLTAAGVVAVDDDSDAWVEAQCAAFRDRLGAEQRFANGAVYALEHADARAGGVVTTARDETLGAERLRALGRRVERAEAADIAKSRFLRAANHDLRQPMATLKFLLYDCMTTDNPTHRAELLHAMDVSISIMEDLLGALLQIGQLDAGAIRPRIDTFQVGQLLDRVRIEFGHQAASAGLDLRIVPSSAAIRSDKALLERILHNFVANAIKHTPSGRVLVGCRRRGGALAIEVRDTGPGIAPADQARVFDEFYQVVDEGRLTGARNGLGLGLNIVRRLAELLAHPVTLHSEPGSGAAFMVTVPLGDVRQSSLGEPDISELIGGEFSDVAALLVEDDETLRSAVTNLLERWGIRVVSANGLAQVRRIVEEDAFEPAIVIADYTLRDGANGADAAAMVATRLGRPVPCVIMTADTAPARVAAIRDRGHPILIKPVSPPRLRALMHNLLFEPELLALGVGEEEDG
jgi:signal transduction histidine kinase/CheY-like chemotaxis protein